MGHLLNLNVVRQELNGLVRVFGVNHLATFGLQVKIFGRVSITHWFDYYT